MKKIAINGFGRIGRAAFKIALDKPNLEVAAINDLSDSKILTHLLKYDTVYGQFKKQIESNETQIIVDNKKYQVFSEKDPSKLPWKDLEIDVVIESTGFFRNKEQAGAHISAGAKKVALSAPPKDETIKTYVLGVNDEDLSTTKEKIVSCASCTTNCIAPIIKVINDRLCISKALMSTIHSYTADQNLVDGSHKDLRRARAAAINIVPTSTGAAISTCEVVPALRGLFDGIALRVPTPIVSLSDITCLVKRKTTAEEVNKILKQAAETNLKNILAVSEQELVSSDFIGNPHSAIADLLLTQVVAGDLVKIIAWYDNEWGYANRLVELVGKLAV